MSKTKTTNIKWEAWENVLVKIIQFKVYIFYFKTRKYFFINFSNKPNKNNEKNKNELKKKEHDKNILYLLARHFILFSFKIWKLLLLVILDKIRRQKTRDTDDDGPVWMYVYMIVLWLYFKWVL